MGKDREKLFVVEENKQLRMALEYIGKYPLSTDDSQTITKNMYGINVDEAITIAHDQMIGVARSLLKVSDDDQTPEG